MSDSTPIWHKGASAADWVTRFTVGDDFVWDTLLLPYDLTASEAHAWGLWQAGILTESEFNGLASELEILRAKHAKGTLKVHAADEDCHTVIERELTRRLGDAGRRVHTGRSRNDQVLAALRLFLRDQIVWMGSATSRLAASLCDLAGRHPNAVMPGYTHMQRAMPSTVASWALGFAELLAEDLRGLGEALHVINVSPLGSAAGYGVPYLDLPREQVARRLGFRAVQEHVTSVQLSRGKQELHVVHALLQVAATVNRLSADLVQYASAEFAFVSLPEAYTTGSSIMPQKRNPDVLELARASYHRIHAEMTLLAGLPANLPSGYHRDLQYTKAAVMRAVLAMVDLLSAMNAMIPGISFDEERLAACASDELFATAAALRLVDDGVPFREAYKAAAGDPEAWKAERDAGGAYRTSGAPGRENADGVRARLSQSGTWMAGYLPESG